MTICPRCGTQNPPESGTCGMCGAELPVVTAPLETSKAAADLGRTQALPRPEFGRTMMGHGTPEAPPQGRSPGADAPAPLPRADGTVPRTTTLGMAPFLPTETRGRTVLGLAPPGPAIAAAPGSTTLVMKPAAAATPAAAEAPAGPGGNNEFSAPPHTRTILGVARPGIAPINPGQQKPDAPLFPSPPPPPPLLLSPLPEPAPPVAAKRSAGKLGLLALGSAGLLLAAALVLFLSMRTPPKVEGRPGLDASGNEQLELTCEECEDGTRVQVGGAISSFQQHRAQLKLGKELPIGLQTLTLELLKPGSEDAREATLSVRVDYRVRADLSGLAEPSPRLRVVVAAVPGSTVRVADKPVTLDAQGHGTYTLAVESELSGPASSVVPLEKQVTYSVKPPDADTQQGQVSFRLGIVPLLIEAPGASITTDQATFVLAGRTQKGALVSVAERPLSVDAEGRFAQVMNVSKIGETRINVRASSKDQAPRLVPLRVRRVASLRDEAARARSDATTSYAAIATATEAKRGWQVAFDGSVLEVRNQLHSTLFVLDTTSGCPKRPCLTRVVYGASSALKAGDKLSVFGSVSGAVDGPRGARVPEVLADFIVGAAR